MRLFVILVAVALGFLVATNPGPDEFAAFVDEEVGARLAEEAADLPGGGILGDLGGLAAGRIAQRYADRDNYGVASVYTLDLDGRARDEVQWRFLGIATLFVPLQTPDGAEPR